MAIMIHTLSRMIYTSYSPEKSGKALKLESGEVPSVNPKADFS